MNTTLYAAYNVNEKERMESSSGGIYSLIAEYVINHNGTVYAACYNEKLEVQHCRIDSVQNIVKSRGSKYVQSLLGDTYQRVYSDLNENRMVLFVGTPCQCAGLLKFLPEKFNYNLICVDFICHGVPSKKTWEEYKRSVEKKVGKINSVNMRNKSTGWSKCKYSWKINGGNREYIQPQSENTYMRGFIANLYLRPSCYKCCFKGINRQTDITLGDFWGVWNLMPDMDDNKGTSLVFVHSEKGKRILEDLKGKMIIAEADIEEAIKINTSMIKSSTPNIKSVEFRKRMVAGEDFINVVQDLLKLPLQERLKNMFKNKVSRIIRKISSGGAN